MCFEGISELAATEIEEEPLWDGQAKSSRYQDFSRSGFVTPPELDGRRRRGLPAAAGEALLAAYAKVQRAARSHACAERLPRPDDMKPDAYQRNIAARAFDVARYLLFWGVPTNVGQVTSIRTLEKQIRRLKASEYGELRELGDEIAAGVRRRAGLPLGPRRAGRSRSPPRWRATPTPTTHAAESRRRSAASGREQNLPPAPAARAERVDLLRPTNVPADIAATLLYPGDRPALPRAVRDGRAAGATGGARK